MAKQSSQLAIEELKKLLREKEELDGVAAERIKELTAELKGNDQDSFDPVQRIIDGFTHFRINNYDKNPEMYQQLALGQCPKFLLVVSSDSRVSPCNIFNLRPGEAFIVRNLSNLVPPFNQLRYSDFGAAIEFAITVLKVPNIVVVGSTLCGGIRRLLSHPEDGSPPFDFIDDWLKIAAPAKAKVQEEFADYDFEEQSKILEKVSVNNSLVNLQTYPYVQRELKNKNLQLFGGHYDFVNGQFKLWKYKTYFTEPITIP